MNILEELFSGATELPDKKSPIHKSYFREKNRINQCYNSIIENLSENDLKTFEKYINSEHKMREIENMRFFVNGFKAGMNFAIENS
ncbi:MAG: hypothetical protein IJX57_03720 [Clostridia bacterium]|nr:hypothetical protein [Clostridia bacterium]